MSMNISRYLAYFLCSVFITFMSCSNDDSTSPNGSGSATMSAKIDGSEWTGTISGASNASGLMSWAGQDDKVRQIQFRIFGVTQAGTYDIGGTVMNMNFAQVSEGTKVWTTGVGTGSGKITFTKVSNTEAEGTFSITLGAVASTGATGTKNVTDGKFNVKFN